MKENAKLVLPKIAPFNKGEDDPLTTLKEDDEPKTRSNRKRVSRPVRWLAPPACIELIIHSSQRARARTFSRDST